MHFIALFGVTLLPSELRPLPDTPRDCSREPVPQLPCHHNQLSPMMSLVRGKVGQEVLQVRREVLPRRPGHAATMGDAKFNEANHALAAARQRQHQLFRSDPTQVDQPRHFDAMSSAHAFDPAAPAVVDVGSNHPDRQPRDARDLLRPDSTGEVFDKVGRRPVVRPPCSNDRPTSPELSRHISSFHPPLECTANGRASPAVLPSHIGTVWCVRCQTASEQAQHSRRCQLHDGDEPHFVGFAQSGEFSSRTPM